MEYCSFKKTLSKILLLVLGFLYAENDVHAAPDTPATQKLKIAMVSAEHSDFLFTGGLGHAVKGAGESLNAQADIDLTFITPGYESALKNKEIQKNLRNTKQTISVPLNFQNGHAQKQSEFLLWEYTSPKSKAKTLLFSHQHGSALDYFGNVDGSGKKFYGPPQIKGEAFGAWGKAVADHILNSDYDLVVLNEWHTGFVAPFIQDARLQGRPTPKMIFAVHNMGYTEPMPGSMLDFLGINHKYFTADGLEYHGQLSPFKAGFEYSDVAYAVSKTYAGEVEQERFSKDLAGLARKKREHHRLLGVMNGIDASEWNPATAHGGLIEHSFSVKDMSGKALGKRDLQKEFGLPQKEKTPILALTSRISEQKGFDYLLPALDEILKTEDVQVIIAGDYDQQKYGSMLEDLSRRYPEKFKHHKFDKNLEHRLTAYADLFNNSPLWEPSGLNQMFAQMNGTPPVVSAVGGLKDSVQDGKTGYLLDLAMTHDGSSVHYDDTQKNVVSGLKRALNDYHNDPNQFKKIQTAGMKIENSWDSRIPQFKAMFDYVRGEGPTHLMEAGVEAVAGRSAIELNNLAQTHGAGSRCPGLLKVLTGQK